jgi:hypothetical protein
METKRKHIILYPQARRAIRRTATVRTTLAGRVNDVCACFPAAHPGTHPGRNALYRLVKGCQTVEQGRAQVEILALVRRLQSGDAHTLSDFATGISQSTANDVDPAI